MNWLIGSVYTSYFVGLHITFANAFHIKPLHIGSRTGKALFLRIYGFLMMCVLAGYLLSLCLHFLLCKIKTIKFTFRVLWGLNKIMSGHHFAQCLAHSCKWVVSFIIVMFLINMQVKVKKRNFIMNYRCKIQWWIHISKYQLLLTMEKLLKCLDFLQEKKGEDQNTPSAYGEIGVRII